MASRADTLKIAQADLRLVNDHLFTAANHLDAPRSIPTPDVAVFRAVLVLENTVKQLRKSFRLEKKEKGNAG